MSNDGILNSVTSLAARSIMNPLITNEKRPRVTKLIGIETSIKSGLMVWLITASTTAVISATHAVPKESEMELKIRGTPTPVT